MTGIVGRAILPDIDKYFHEDDLSRNFAYISKLPEDLVDCSLKFKSDMVVAGLPHFFETFQYLLNSELSYSEHLDLEGKFVNANSSAIAFKLPFNVAIAGERLALNLLQHASSIATFTKKFVDKAQKYNINILDTRKTTPGLRALEKYAVQVGGGKNHRFGSVDTFMIKDNHKKFFGGIKGAMDFFKSINSFYTGMVVEIHSIDELKEASDLGLTSLMLDNFSSKMLYEAMALKTKQMTYEVSGGVTLETVDRYFIEGVDAISIGSLTYNAPAVDVSLKYERFL